MLLDVFCITLGSVYLLGGTLATINLIRILGATSQYNQQSPQLKLSSLLDDGSGRTSFLGRPLRPLRPWTTQTALHMIIAGLFLVRVVWFGVVTVVWDSSEGRLRESCQQVNRLVFYGLDLIAQVFYFMVYACLASFWAETYYIAVDEGYIFRGWLLPLYRTCTVVVWLCAGTILALYGIVYPDFDKYISSIYGATFMIALTLEAFALLTYTRKATLELQLVPIDLQMRRKKIADVAKVTMFSTLAVLLRAVLFPTMADRHFKLNTGSEIGSSIVYFVLLEFVPLGVVLLYHKKMPVTSRFVRGEEMRLFSQSAGGPSAIPTESDPLTAA